MKHQKEIEKIEQFIIEQASTVEGVVVGISGGLDSAIVATLCVRALGKHRVRLVHMPETLDKVDKDAVQLASNLGIRMPILLIKQISDVYQMHCPDTFGTALGRGNLKARIRMSMLYGYSNEFNLLVMGTTNFSEWMTGYFTKYGDGGVDIEPLLHLHKTDLYELAGFLPEIPLNIIEKPPAAGLGISETDEEELEMSYFELDINIKQFLKNNTCTDRAMSLIRFSHHKRNTVPNLLEVNR